MLVNSASKTVDSASVRLFVFLLMLDGIFPAFFAFIISKTACYHTQKRDGDNQPVNIGIPFYNELTIHEKVANGVRGKGPAKTGINATYRWGVVLVPVCEWPCAAPCMLIKPSNQLSLICYHAHLGG